MEKTVFQGKECFVAYKALFRDMSNVMINYQYETNHWYEALDVDMSNNDCSYGLNLCQTKAAALEYGPIVFKCYVPVDTKIKFIEGKDKFRCLRMYLTDETFKIKEDDRKNNNATIPSYQEWDSLSEDERDIICAADDSFPYQKYWNELTEYQKSLLCSNNPTFRYQDYWDELTEYQRSALCRDNKSFKYNKYWNDLTEYQKDLLCQYRPDFDANKYWSELSKKQKDLVCQYNQKLDYKKFWNELTTYQKLYLAQHIVIKR